MELMCKVNENADFPTIQYIQTFGYAIYYAKKKKKPFIAPAKIFTFKGNGNKDFINENFLSFLFKPIRKLAWVVTWSNLTLHNPLF